MLTIKHCYTDCLIKTPVCRKTEIGNQTRTSRNYNNSPVQEGQMKNKIVKLCPVLYLLYTCDIPQLENNTIATFADDTAIMATGATQEEAVEKVQTAVNIIFDWTKKWRVKLNESKSVHIDFTNKRTNYHPVNINGHVIPYENTAKYLGMTLDVKLRWKAHVKKKRDELDLRYKSMYWLIGKNSSLYLWYSALGLYQTKQHQNYTAFSKQSTQRNRQCALVHSK